MTQLKLIALSQLKVARLRYMKKQEQGMGVVHRSWRLSSGNRGWRLRRSPTMCSRAVTRRSTPQSQAGAAAPPSDSLSPAGRHTAAPRQLQIDRPASDWARMFIIAGCASVLQNGRHLQLKPQSLWEGEVQVLPEAAAEDVARECNRRCSSP